MGRRGANSGRVIPYLGRIEFRSRCQVAKEGRERANPLRPSPGIQADALEHRVAKVRYQLAQRVGAVEPVALLQCLFSDAARFADLGSGHVRGYEVDRITVMPVKERPMRALWTEKNNAGCGSL